MSFSLVSALRRITKIRCIGHAGTLDPFASGLMILLIGREFTKKSDLFLNHDKKYSATIKLGQATDSYDIDGQLTNSSDIIPTLSEIESILKNFQGVIQQIPPMYSAKKIAGKKLYELARQGKEVERSAQNFNVSITLKSYDYPHLEIDVSCSKGCYIRSLAHDIGLALGSFGHLIALRRTHSGPFSVEQSHSIKNLTPENYGQFLISDIK